MAKHVAIQAERKSAAETENHRIVQLTIISE